MIFPDYTTAIAALDLDPIKVKLMHKESGEGWSLPYANAVEAEYRRYLQLMKRYPSAQVAPSFDVDTFWHYHILDTMKYGEDCSAVFGYFLHHFPYVGLRGVEDEQVHAEAGERMQQLYETTFGVPYVRDAAAAVRTGEQAASGRNPDAAAFSINPGVAAVGASARDPHGVAFSINPGAAVAGATARDPHGVAFSINPGAAVAGASARDPHGVAFSINPGAAVAGANARDPNGVAFSINPGATVAGASARDPNGVAFSINPGAGLPQGAVDATYTWPTPSLTRPTIPAQNNAN